MLQEVLRGISRHFRISEPSKRLTASADPVPMDEKSLSLHYFAVLGKGM